MGRLAYERARVGRSAYRPAGGRGRVRPSSGPASSGPLRPARSSGAVVRRYQVSSFKFSTISAKATPLRSAGMSTSPRVIGSIQ